MANTTAPRGARFNGWFWDAVNSQLKLYRRGTLVATAAANDITFADDVTMDDLTVGDVTASGAVSLPQALTIGAIAYTFPADNGDAGEQLQTDGAGALTWEASGV
jgi:hypothetical protein